MCACVSLVTHYSHKIPTFSWEGHALDPIEMAVFIVSAAYGKIAVHYRVGHSIVSEYALMFGVE